MVADYTADATAILPGSLRGSRDVIRESMALAFEGPLKGTSTVNKQLSLRFVGAGCGWLEPGPLRQRTDPRVSEAPSSFLVRFASARRRYATVVPMPDIQWHMDEERGGEEVSLRDLRNHVSEVLRRVEGGTPLTVTVDRRPVARLVPLTIRRTSMPAGEFFAQLGRIGGADPELRDELREMLTETTDDIDFE
jgi:prevent-host-death family protein